MKIRLQKFRQQAETLNDKLVMKIPFLTSNVSLAIRDAWDELNCILEQNSHWKNAIGGKSLVIANQSAQNVFLRTYRHNFITLS